MKRIEMAPSFLIAGTTNSVIKLCNLKQEEKDELNGMS